MYAIAIAKLDPHQEAKDNFVQTPKSKLELQDNQSIINQSATSLKNILVFIISLPNSSFIFNPPNKQTNRKNPIHMLSSQPEKWQATTPSQKSCSSI